MPYENYATLSERLLARVPFRGPLKAAFFNAGSEAVENAVKFARAFTGRQAVIGFEGAFHGRTYLSLALTSRTNPYKQGLGPFAPEVYRVPFPNAFRGLTAGEALAALRRAFSTLVAAEDVAAIVFEPVQGEGGFIPASREFVEGLREICDEHGIVLVCDEVQSGFGRTGRFFAIEHFGVEPDLITVAKSIAMGLPLSGVLGRAEIMDAPLPGGVGGTYVGNPVAIAAALAVLDVIEEEGLVERSAAIGELMRSRMLESWQARWPQIGDVRGLGGMLAVELVQDEDKVPATDLASRVVGEALARGLLLLKAGVPGNCIRVLVPLVISDGELEEALDVWEDALWKPRSRHVERGVGSPGDRDGRRRPLRPLRARGARRQRRHVERLSGARPAARPQGRTEGPARAVHRGRRACRALSTRGAGSRNALASEHRHGDRSR